MKYLRYTLLLVLTTALFAACDDDDGRFTNVPANWRYDSCTNAETPRIGQSVNVNSFCAEAREFVLGCDRGEPRYEMTPTCFTFEEPRRNEAYLFLTPGRFPFPDDPRWTEYGDGVECVRAMQQQCPDVETTTQ